MPEYRVPDVIVKEIGFGTRSIEAVDSNTSAFIGPARKGPLDAVSDPITSVAEFQSVYGGFHSLEFANGETSVNYLAHAVRNFFDNGGRRLHVARVFSRARGSRGVAASGHIGDDADDANNIRFFARSPGCNGNGTIEANLAESEAAAGDVRAAPEGTVVRVGRSFCVRHGDAWIGADGDAVPEPVSEMAVFVTVSLACRDGDGKKSRLDGFGLGPGHPRYIGDLLSAEPADRKAYPENTFTIEIGSSVTPLRLREIFAGLRKPVQLSGGSDGVSPTAATYAAALDRLARIDDIAIVAAPGSSSFREPVRHAIEESIIAHVERPSAWRFAVLDTAPKQSIADVLVARSRIDSSHAALYYPWVVTTNPLARPDDPRIPVEVSLPPSGFVCGVYARSDSKRSVAKAPANEAVRGALRLEKDVSATEQGVLNPVGVNCLRRIPGQGIQVWGARTASSDPDWRYVNVRRLISFLEHSIARGIRWAATERNGPELWTQISRMVGGFLFDQWKNGLLHGTKPDDAWFVRCDASTMTQDDLDNGRLVCLVGVAPLEPAEFVTFRIWQTIDQTGV